MIRSVELGSDLKLVKELARHIQKNMPSLSDLTIEQLEEIAKTVVYQRLVKKLDYEVSVSGIDCRVEEKLFLENPGKRCCVGIQKVYEVHLRKLR